MNKQEAEAKRKQLGQVKIPEGTESWMRWCDKEGRIWTQPPVKKTLSPEEIARREAEEKKKREDYSKAGQKVGLAPIGADESIKDYLSKLAAKKKEIADKLRVENAEKRLKEQKEREEAKRKEKLEKIAAKEKALEEQKKALLGETKTEEKKENSP